MITLHLPSRMREELNLESKTLQSEFNNGSLADFFDQLENQVPGSQAFLFAEPGAMKKHIKVFLAERQVTEPLANVDLQGHENIRVIQAMAGG